MPNTTRVFLGEEFRKKWACYASYVGESYSEKRGKVVSTKFFDVVVVTAMDTVQGEHFKAVINDLHKSHSIPSPEAVSIEVVPDPPQRERIGCGGSTMEVIKCLHDKYGEDVWNKRVLILHSGGYSKRLPICSFVGKAFTAVPWVSLAGKVATLFEVKLASLIHFCANGLVPGFFVTSSDVIEMFDDNAHDFGNEPGFTAFAHPVLAEVGFTHGVFAFGNEKDFTKTIVTRRYLHRATLDEMRAAGALFKLEGGGDEDHVFVDSCYFFDSATVAKRLLDFYLENSPLKYEIDAYGDFLQPLGPDATEDYLLEARNAAVTSQGLLCMRRAVGRILAGTSLRAVPLIPSEFVHFGTHPEFISFICGGLQDMGFPSSVSSYLLNEDKRDGGNKSLTLMGSYVGHDVTFGGPCALEYCYLRGNVVVGKNAILSDVRTRESGTVTEIPGDAQIITLALRAEAVPGVAAETLGGVVYATLVAHGDELKSNPAAWREPRFPVARTPEGSLEASLYGGDKCGDCVCDEKISWEMAIAMKNLSEQIRMREELEVVIEKEMK